MLAVHRNARARWLLLAGLSSLASACGARDDLSSCAPGLGACSAGEGGGGAGGGGAAPVCGATWAKGFAATKDTRAQAVAVDPAGNVYVTGQFTGTLDLGTGPMVAGPVMGSFFVAKLDCSGATVWARAFAFQWDSGPGEAPEPKSIVVSSSGEVVISGLFAGLLDLGTGPMKSHTVDGFVVALDPGGATRWARDFGDAGGASSLGASVALDASGGVYLSGVTDGAVDLGVGPLAADDRQYLFLAHFDAHGKTLFSRSFGGGAEPISRVAVDAQGQIVFCGNVGAPGGSPYDFGGGPLAPDEGLWCAKLTADGDYLWTRGITAADAFLEGMTLDPSGRVLLVGIAGTADLGGVPVAAATAGEQEGFVFALSPAGEPGFALPLGPSAVPDRLAVAATAGGEVLLAGSFKGGPLDVGLVPMTSQGSYDGFTAVLDPSGKPLSSERFGDAQAQIVPAVAAAPGGARVIAGWYQGSVTVAGHALPVAATGQALVAWIAP